MVVDVEMKKHTMNVQAVHIVEVLVPMKDLGGSPTRVVSISIWCICWRHNAWHSSVEGFYSPSWTYMRLDFSPLDTD